MAITSIYRDFNAVPNIVRIIATNTLAEVAASNYVLAQRDNINALNNGEWEWLTSDIIQVAASDGNQFFEFDGDDFDTFVQLPGGNGEVTLPVVAGNLAMFDGTLGALEDSGIAAADVLESALASGHIFVGNAGGVATDVAMSGDATMANTGALTIANNAVTTDKILDANVTLSKLAPGIAPAGVIKFMGQVTTNGGNATEAFAVVGALAASDRAFVQVVNDGTNDVTVLQAVVTDDLLTVTFSGDPANDTILNYQIIRAAS